MKIREINKVSLTAKDIAIGDKLPVGGHELHDEKEFWLIIDKIPSQLEDALKLIFEKVQTSINNPNNKKWIQEHKIPMSASIFTYLSVFTKIIGQTFPNLGEKKENGKRKELYSTKLNVNFSELFENNAFQCAEYAVLAQLFLQQAGINSEYVGGGCLSSTNAEFATYHSFIIIHDGDKDFVFDPANNNPPCVPNIGIIELTPKQKLHLQAKLLSDKKVAFFETRDIITNAKKIYGYADTKCISEDTIFQKQENVYNNMNSNDSNGL